MSITRLDIGPLLFIIDRMPSATLETALRFHHLLIPIIIIVIGGGIGLLLERIVLVWLRKKAVRTAWAGDNIIFDALRGTLLAACLLVAVYAVTFTVPLTAPTLAVIRKVLQVLAILTVSVFAARIAAGFVEEYTKQAHGVLPSASIFPNLTKLVVLVLGFLTILHMLGVSITPFLTALGVGGLAVALALQDTLSNLFAGLHIILSHQVQPGDYIKLETEVEGYVTDIKWRNTTIRTLTNNLVIIPNVKAASSIITNYHQPDKEMGVLFELGVGFESDLDAVEQVTIDCGREVMRDVQGGIPEFEPLVRFNAFGESSIRFIVILRCREFADQYRIKHEFVKRLMRRYRAAGIKIPYPVRVIHTPKS